MKNRCRELNNFVITRAFVIITVFLLISTATLFQSVMGEEFRDIAVDLRHSPDETPTDIINVGAEYNPDQEILAYETWTKDYQSAGLEMPEGSYVGSFFAEGLLEFDYTPEHYDSWGGQHSFLVVAKNFKFTYEEIMSGSTKWTIKIPVLADCILPQSFPPLLDNYNFAKNWNNTQDYMVDMLKGYPPKFGMWETTDINTDVTFRKNGTELVRFINNELLWTTTPIQLSDSGNFLEPDVFCNVYMPPSDIGSDYYFHLDEDNNFYVTDDYHNDDGMQGFISNTKVINNRIYIEMNYPVKPEINYTMAFVCRLKDNPKIYFTEESIGGLGYTTVKIIELNEPEGYAEPDSTGDPRDFLNVFDFEYMDGDPTKIGLEFGYEEYNRSLPMDSGWDIIFEEGYGNGLFGVEKEVRPGDILQFRPYIEETEDNESLKHVSVMLPFICDEIINPDVFLTYGNNMDVLKSSREYRNGKYRWFSSDAAMLDYDFDGILNYEDPETEYNRYGYNHTYGPCDFYGENPYFYTRLDNIYDGYVDFDWDTSNNNDDDEYYVVIDDTKPYYRPVTAWNASDQIEIFNTTETLIIDLDVFNEGSYHSNITVLNHEKIITVDKIGPLGTYTYDGPATNVIFWRGVSMNQSVPGEWDDTWENMGREETFLNEYGDNVWCRNCLWLDYTMSFWTTNPSDFDWRVYDPGDENFQPEQEGQIYIYKVAGMPRDYFFREVFGWTDGPESVAPLFMVDRNSMPIEGNYSKPYPWLPDVDPRSVGPFPSPSFDFPTEGYDYFDGYDQLFQDILSVKVYDSTGTKYEMGTDYEMHVLGNQWYYKDYFILAFNVINDTETPPAPMISNTTELFIEIWIPSTYMVRPLFRFGGVWDDGWVIFPEDDPLYYEIDPNTPCFSPVEKPLMSMPRHGMTGTDRWNWATFGPYSLDSYYNGTIGWHYPGVSATKMSDSDGINASDYLLFSTRNTFLQDPNPDYPSVGNSPTSPTTDIYAEDGFVAYVIFRTHANITFLCYDPEDTSMKNTNLTNKFYFINGADDTWLSSQGNQYLSEPVWKKTHVLNEWWLPTDESLWNDGLSVMKGGTDWVYDDAESGEVLDLFKDIEYNNLSSPLFWFVYPALEYTHETKYYAPIQSQYRTSTEVYHFSLYNSASFTDGEWTQVLVEPEYVWTSVPRFNTQINIGNYFITVAVPGGEVDIDVFSGVDSNILSDIASGLADYAKWFVDGMINLFSNIGSTIWNGLKYLYDGASEVPGWIAGAFTKLIEYIRAFGAWVVQVLLNFAGIIKNLIEELLDFVDFSLQLLLFILPFVMFMLVVNYYQMFLVKARLAMRNLKGKRRGEQEVHRDD